jgi:hypothetical protein
MITAARAIREGYALLRPSAAPRRQFTDLQAFDMLPWARHVVHSYLDNPSLKAHDAG